MDGWTDGRTDGGQNTRAPHTISFRLLLRRKLKKQAGDPSDRLRHRVSRESREVHGPHDTVSYFMEVLDLPYFLVCRKTQNSGHFWSLPVHFYSLPVHF